jgi:deazaflavin-dependent oxidoreductase (nitroreductase family)
MRGPREWSSAVNDWNAKVIEEFRANGGVVGGPSAGQPLLLLHTTGARSGTERVTPMVYFASDGRLFVFASKDGASTHPDWFHNLVADPDVVVELGTETFAATAKPLSEHERATVFARATGFFPRLTTNAATTDRVIPVVELERR